MSRRVLWSVYGYDRIKVLGSIKGSVCRLFKYRSRYEMMIKCNILNVVKYLP